MDPAELERALRAPPPRLSAGRPAAVMPVHLYGEPAALTEIAALAARPRAAADRGLRAKPRRRISRAGDRLVRRFRLLQLLPDQESGRARRRRRGGHRRSRARRGGARDARIWLARPLCQRDPRDQYPARPDPGRHPQRQARHDRARQCPPPGDRRALRCGSRRAAARAAAPAQRASHVFHQYVVRTPERDRLREHLRQAGIGTGIHYPLPVHLQPAYRGRIAAGPVGAVQERGSGAAKSSACRFIRSSARPPPTASSPR